MKKNLLFMLFGVMLTLPTYARDFTYTYEGQTLTYTVLDENAKTCETKVGSIFSGYPHTPGNKVSGNLIIPEIAIDGDVEYSVTSIGVRAFSCCFGLTEVIIPNSVTLIGNCAFEYCSELTAVNIGNSVSRIGSDAFYNCSGLTNLKIPTSVTSIGISAFYNCSSLTEITLPNSVETIGEYAFSGCNSLTSMIIPNSVTSIGDRAFEGCIGLTSISLLDGNEIELGYSVFSGTNIKNAYIGRPISQYLLLFDFSTLTNLETLTIGNTVTEIGASVWINATELKNLTLGSSLTSIGDNAFSGCTALTEVIIPPTVETVGSSAFAGNTALKSIIMGHNVKTIGEKAFDGCPANSVSITALTPPTAPNNTFSNYSGKLWVQNQNAIPAYRDASTCWNLFDGYAMIEPTEFEYSGERNISGKPGDTFQLSARLMPENVTLPQVFWRSTNPEIATVDANGLVTLHADSTGLMTLSAEDEEETGRTCKIIAESLYADGPVVEVSVSDVTTGIEDITADSMTDDAIDFNASIEVYNLNGFKVSNGTDNLAPGIYIIRQGKAVKKFIVK